MHSVSYILKQWILKSNTNKFSINNLEVVLPIYGRAMFNVSHNSETYNREWRRIKNGRDVFSVEDENVIAIIKKELTGKRYYNWIIERTKKENE